jgi:hypothetical protein
MLPFCAFGVLVGVDDHIDVIAWQREASHAHHIVDANRDGALAVVDDGGEPPLRPPAPASRR